LKDDGSQPHELARTLSWGYSVMNLKGFFILAQLADAVPVDLWRYETPDGKSIKKAFLWMLPYAEGKKAWTHPQIKTLHPEEFRPLMVVASSAYSLSELPPLPSQVNKPDDSLFQLTHSLF